VTWLELYAVIVVFLGAVPATLFPLAYARRDWRATAAGRAIMTLVVALAALYDLSVAVVICGPFPGLDVLRAVVFTFTTAAVTRLFFTMVHRNRRRT
jgi:hypothetical protein